MHVPHEGRPQNFVPPDNLMDRPFQGGFVEGALQRQDQPRPALIVRPAVDLAHRLEDEPLLLPPGQRQLSCARDRLDPDRGLALAGHDIAVECGRQSCDRQGRGQRFGPDGPDYPLVQGRQHPNGGEGIASQREEVIVPADAVQTQDLLPHSGNPGLQGALRRLISRGQLGPVCAWER
jgi:hypothetical protein